MSYNADFFATLMAVEDRHFWFSARKELILRVLKHIRGGMASRPMFLEIGCGTGNVLRWLERIWPTGCFVGLDLHLEGLRFARGRTQALLVAADLRALPFRRACFDLVGMFDVLEHVPEDVKALQVVRDLLVPRGILVLTVPADPRLWSYFDEASGHCRRYRRHELQHKLRAAGFRIESLSSFMMLLWPLVRFWRRTFPRRHNPSPAGDVHKLALQDLRVLPVVNGLLAHLLKLEAKWIASGRTLPSGASLLAVARRVDEPA